MVYKQPEHLIFSTFQIQRLKNNNMSYETGIRDMTGYKSIIPPFPETQLTDDWFKNYNQSTISNSHPLTLTTNETTISGMSDFKSIIPPFPETQPTDAWIGDEDQQKIENTCPMSCTVPNSNLWSPLTHQRSYHVRSVLENLLANVTYLVFELEELKSSFPIDMPREDANKEEKLMERSIEKFRQITRQVRKSKREIMGMLEDGVYVNPRNYDRSKYSTAASLEFEIQE